MRAIQYAFAAFTLICANAFASTVDPKSGAEYMTLATPQPIQVAGKKVEVIEFFMYHCPHCFALDPELTAWVAKRADKVNFLRIHVPYKGADDPEAHLFLSLEAMGRSDLHSKVFRAWHIEKKRLHTDAAISEWIASQDIDKAKFLAMWNSFSVLTKLKRLQQTVNDYKVENVPTFIVDGRYQTSPSIVDAALRVPQNNLTKATLEVLDALVAKAAK